MLDFLKVHPWYQLLLLIGLVGIVITIHQLISGGLSLPKISLPKVGGWFKRTPKPAGTKKAAASGWPWWKTWGAGCLLVAVTIAVIGSFSPSFPALLGEKIMITASTHPIALVVLVAATLLAGLFGQGVSWTVRALVAIAFMGLMYNSDSPVGVYTRYTDSPSPLMGDAAASKNGRLITTAEIAAMKTPGEIGFQIIKAPPYNGPIRSEPINDLNPNGTNLKTTVPTAFCKNLGSILKDNMDGTYIVGPPEGEVVYPPNGRSALKVQGGEQKFSTNELNPGGTFQSRGSHWALLRVSYSK